jgi:hypothetical protein
MPMHVYWSDPEQTIIRCDSEGSWTWEDYHAAVDEIVLMMKSVPHRVDMINFVKENSSRPKGSSQPHFQRALKMFPSNLAMHVLVTKNALARAMVALWRSVRGNKLGDAIYLVATVDDAYAIIAENRAKQAEVEEKMQSV